MPNTTDRRSVLGLLAAAPLVASLPARALEITRTRIAAPVVSRIAASPSREVEISRWRATGKRRGTIAFSHGFGSSPGYYPDFIKAWTGAGYEIVAPLHVDSREYRQPGKFDGSAGWAARIEDMRAVSRLIGGRYVAAGHSYGALTALVICGVDAVVPPGIMGPLADPLAICAVAFSPPGPMPTLVSAEGFAALARPALIQTGTRDIPFSPGASPAPDAWRAHLTAFDRAPATGEHFGLVVEGVDHYFGGLICDYSKSGPDQRAALDAATRCSLAFIDAQAHSHAGHRRARPAFPQSPLVSISVR